MDRNDGRAPDGSTMVGSAAGGLWDHLDVSRTARQVEAAHLMSVAVQALFMPMSPSRWIAVTQSNFRWELEALDWMRQHLPDHDPWRVWSNFEFIADDGSVNEVDALVLSPVGLFLVEIKSQPGIVSGDAHTWYWTTDGRSRSHDNPLILANRKAKRLASLLRRQPAFTKGRYPIPRVEALVFLSAREMKCRLSGAARSSVHLRGNPGLPDDVGIIGAVSTFPTRNAQGSGTRIDQPWGRSLARGVEEAGIRPSRAMRRIGDYDLGALLQEGDAYQDWEGTHVSLTGALRRIRVYPYAPTMGPEQRKMLYRLASREYEILDSLDHQGILRVREFSESERGPALLFEHGREVQRLDLYLAERLPTLPIDVRLGFLRQLAETLRYAHDRHVYHRALSPQSILVRDPESRTPRLQIFNWQAASRKTGTAGGQSGATIAPEAFVEQPALIYLAPELLHEPDRRGPHLDVFSLGAIAFHLFAGKPPAGTLVELTEKLTQGKGLRLSDVIDGACVSLQTLVEDSTTPKVAARIASMDDFLTYLSEVEEELTAPAPERFVGPITAAKGDRLEGGFTVDKRLGKGSTAVALLVRRDGTDEERVLKVTLDPSLNDRLRREASALDRLRHPNVVELFDGNLTIGGHAALLMARAGTETLREVLDRHGRLSIDVLERYGEDLLAALLLLEQQGINHRDIKPANIGVGLLGRKGRKGLVLFDFSLSAAPPEDIAAGTRPYLDPFLRLRRRWDQQAEHFAAAVTLFEMATGTLPQWGDGESDPALIEVEATIDSLLFDPAVRDDLAVFFRKALARDATRRFDNAEQMQRAWRRVFDAVRRAVLTPDTPDEAFEALLRRLGPTTTIAELGFSDAAQNVLDDMGIHTVRELLAVDRVVFRYLRHVSDRVRKEIRQTAKALATRRPDLRLDRSLPAEDASAEDEGGSIDALFERLLPRRGFAEASSDIQPIDLLLGYDALQDDTRNGGETHWRSLGEAAAAAGKARASLANALIEARGRWLTLPPIDVLRDDIAGIVEAHGEVLSADELARALVAARGCVEPVPKRWAMAAAVARAAIETEATADEPRFLLTLRNGPALIAETPSLADYAKALGDAADRIADEDAVPTPPAALERLRAVPLPEGVEPLPDWRLPPLAVAASSRAALSSRSEIYPVGMPAFRALALAAGTLLGAKSLAIAAIRDRVEGRYRRAEPLPDRPALDGLLTAAGLDVVWDPSAEEGGGAYVTGAGPSGPGSSTGRTPPRHTTVQGAVTDHSPEVDSALGFEERLTRSLSAGAFLAFVVPHRDTGRAETELTRERFGVERVSLDAVLIEAMRAEATALGADWDTVLAADAADPGSLDWRRLLMLVRRCVPAVERRLMAASHPLLLTEAGLIGRYGLMDMLERLRDAAGRPGGPPALWLLAPSDTLIGAPMLERLPVPVLGSTQWARVPEAWMANRHRA